MLGYIYWVVASRLGISLNLLATSSPNHSPQARCFCAMDNLHRCVAVLKSELPCIANFLRACLASKHSTSLC